VSVIQGDTERTPDQGYTVGSKTIQRGGPPIRQAAAEARRTLLTLAAAYLNVAPEPLTVDDGVVAVRGNGGRRVTYAELIGGRRFERAVTTTAAVKRPGEYRVVGKSVARVDIPGKVTGAASYVQDLRLPGMVHGRVVRPPTIGATVESVDEASVRDMPGVVRVVREANFVGVVAEREEQAIRAAQSLKVTWNESRRLPDMAELYRDMRSTRTSDKILSSRGDAATAFAGAAKTVDATYEWPFQMHASIGPSCAVAHVTDDRATIWCASQGVFGLRDSLARLLKRPAERVHLVFAEAAGWLRPQRRRRRGRRRCASVEGGGSPRARSVDAARRARLGAQGAGHGHAGAGRRRCRGQRRGVGVRRVDADSLHAAPGGGRKHAGRSAPRSADQGWPHRWRPKCPSWI
jgi:CO/xanthine dehydrogenase Mo-binding subunit